MIFTQNAEQRKTGEWLYSVPDAFGRIVQTGICHNTNISNNNYKDKLVVGTYEVALVIPFQTLALKIQEY